MKATGIVRRIDDLGRVVIPKEIRRTMRIREGDPLEIYTDRDGEVIFKKYSPIGELAEFASQYAETLYKTCGLAVAICDRVESIGVDIEKCSVRLLDKRLTDRFFPGLSQGKNEISVKIEAPCEIEPGERPDTLFTLGEAIIKCDGRGFAAAGEAASLSIQMKKASFKITLSGVEYALSVAVL